MNEPPLALQPGLEPDAPFDKKLRIPRGIHPETWRLSQALLACVQRLPYATGEARLIDGVQRFVRLEARAPRDGVSLTPSGPRWAAVLRVVAAIAPLVSEESRRLLAPWAGTVPAAPGQGAIGISPHAADAAAFAAGRTRP